jgi:hypothetical protein
MRVVALQRFRSSKARLNEFIDIVELKDISD